MKKYFAYVLQSISHDINYVGMAEDIRVRLEQHNKGKSKFTSSYAPWKIIYVEEFDSRLSARKREKYLKSAAGRRFLNKQLAGGNSSSLPE